MVGDEYMTELFGINVIIIQLSIIIGLSGYMIIRNEMFRRRDQK